MTARRQHSGSTRLVSRGRVEAMPVWPDYPRAVVRDRCAEILPLIRLEKLRRAAWLIDEVAGWRYAPRAAGVERGQ